MRKVSVIFIVLALGAPLAWANPPNQPAPCDGVRWDNGVPLCPTGDGHWEIIGPEGQSLGFTHGSDPLSILDDAGGAPSVAASGDVQCVSGAPGTYHIRVIYARAYNDADNYASSVSLIRNLVAGSQQYVNDAALATGSGTASLKVRCSSGVVTVDNAVLPTSKASATYATIFNDLENAGYNDPKVKYWVWYDDTGACTCAGIGHIYYDERPGVENYNNGNGAVMFAVTFGYNSVRTMLHELSHNLGAVQKGSPHTTGAGHCWDGRDTMCYNDGGPNGWKYTTGICSTEVYDCGRDDYFHLSPPSGSYLATKWNLGHTNNRYMAIVKNLAPTMTSLSCAPTTATVGETVTCSFAATDPTDSVAYNVEWGDGTTQRVPATGYVASGTTQSASRAYGSDGSFTFRVTATDNNASAPLTSAPLTAAITVQAAPIMVALSCSPTGSQPGISVTCSFRADDNSSGVYYRVDWGDGSGETRVPATGLLAPGQTRSATHTWGAAGSYIVGVNATDNGSPALTSSTMTTVMEVQPNQAPVMTALSCTPNPVQAENPTTCSFSASDAYNNVYYELDWGDGSPPVRVPSSGSVPAGVTQQVSRIFTTEGDRTVSVTATDTDLTPLTSAPRTTLLAVTPPNVAPVIATATCTVSGAMTPTTCTFRASDPDSTGVRYSIDWGDGTSTVAPTTSYAPVGTDFQVQHVYDVKGTYLLTVTATDNGSPAKTGAAAQVPVEVTEDAAPPTLSVQDPLTRTLYYGCSTKRDIFVGDPLLVGRGCVRATASDASGIANVTVLIDGVARAVDTQFPYVLEFPVPYSRLDASLQVVAYDLLGNAKTVDLRVDLIS